MTLRSIKYSNGKLEILDQLLLPEETTYIPILNVQDGWNAIYKMQVRGAPAIAIVGCLSLAVELANCCLVDKRVLRDEVVKKLNYLVTARPTAVNIKRAANEITEIANSACEDSSLSATEMKTKIIENIEAMLDKDIADNKAIGRFGADAILSASGNSNVRILTHCNTGSLATAGYGTALGVIRSLHERNKIDQVYCTETRPYNQGARLTAYELVYENIPSTLIVDSMVSILMKTRNISAVVVGADRVAANGDTANKIGTYQLAIAAKYHSVPFYIAAPLTSIDMSMEHGDGIVIEERPEIELTNFGTQRIAAKGIKCWNPSFDVTPASLITGIITEIGVFAPQDLKKRE